MKGQNFRLFVKGPGTSDTLQCVAASKSCSINYTADTEESTTKDTTDGEKDFEVVSTSYTVSANGLILAKTDTGAKTGFDLLGLVGKKVSIEFNETTGDNNRTEVTSGLSYSGNAIVTNVSLEFPDRQNSTYSIELQGIGNLEAG